MVDRIRDRITLVVTTNGKLRGTKRVRSRPRESLFQLLILLVKLDFDYFEKL